MAIRSGTRYYLPKNLAKMMPRIKTLLLNAQLIQANFPQKPVLYADMPNAQTKKKRIVINGNLGAICATLILHTLTGNLPRQLVARKRG